MSIESMITHISATLGNKHDLYRIGVIYYEGKKGTQNLEKAKHYLRKAANKRYLKAFYYLGLIEKDKNNTEGNYALALRYFELSKREEILTTEAIETLEKEIFQQEKSDDNADLLFNIGYMYANDNFVPKNYEKAVQYYKRAASYGNHHAKNQLGLAYAYGYLGLDKNLESAFTYLYSAVRYGFTPAKETLYKIFADEAQLSSLRSAMEDNSDLQNIYASMCFYGINTEQNLEEAQKYFERATREDHPDAWYHLYLLTCESAPELALTYYDKAALLKHLEVTTSDIKKPD